MVARPRTGLVLSLALAVLSAHTVPPALEADVRQTVTVDVQNTLALGPALPDYGSAAGLATAELDLEAQGNPDVRARVQLRAELFEDAEGGAVSRLSLPRAELRWRLPLRSGSALRFRAGRTRLSWGDGQLYNAGDVLNGARPPAVDLSARTLRDETRWLLSSYLPLGRFSFLEPVVLIPPTVLGTVATGTADAADSDETLSARPADETAAGMRLQGQVAGIKTEAGYLYRGDEARHQPYLTLQGNLGVDLYGGVRWEWLNNRPEDGPRETLTASVGTFTQGDHPRLGTGSVRVEALWEEDGDRWFVAPDLGWAPSQLLQFFSRTELELAGPDSADPGRMEALRSTLGVRWTPSTGLSVSGVVSWDQDSETLGLTTGLRYVF